MNVGLLDVGGGAVVVGLEVGFVVGPPDVAGLPVVIGMNVGIGVGKLVGLDVLGGGVCAGCKVGLGVATPKLGLLVGFDVGTGLFGMK